MKAALSRFILPLLILFALSAVGVRAQSVAKVFTVNSTADSADATPGDGLCADAEGGCTLRAAVDEANSDAASRDIIVFSMQYPAVIDLTMGSLTIGGEGASIVGPGARRLTVQRSATASLPFRIFHIPNIGTSAVIRGMTISNGVAGELMSGGAVKTGPGTTVQLADAALLNNSGGTGGAVQNEGTMTINRVLMASNTAELYGGAIATGAASNTRITNSTLTLNSAQTGGAIYAGATLLSVNNTITHNSATISASSIRSGVANEVAMLNTIVGSDTTFPVLSMSGSFLSHGNNIVTDARSSTGFANGVNNDQVSDNNVINPLLGPLADNGGQTDTRLPMAASPAVNAGNSCVFAIPCPMFPPQNQFRLFWDQRVKYSRGGILNPVDIGAVESGSTASFGAASFGAIGAGPGPRAFHYNSQGIITNVETGEKIFAAMGPMGIFRTSGLPTGVVFVVEVRTKRAGIRTPPYVWAFPD